MNKKKNRMLILASQAGKSSSGWIYHNRWLTSCEDFKNKLDKDIQYRFSNASAASLKLKN